MATALSSFDRAEQACLLFLGKVLGIEVGESKDIRRGSWLEPALAGAGVFGIGTGPEQTQNFGSKGIGCRWLANAMFQMNFETRAEAIEVLGKIQNGFPGRTGNAPGLQPNVGNFEILEHPDIVDVPLADESGEIIGLYYVLTVSFRVVYNNQQT